MNAAAPRILQIPPEITEHTLVLSHPRDVASFAQTCRSARALVYEARDQHLWRRLFLEQPFDDPRRTLVSSDVGNEALEVDWKKELQRRVFAMRVIQKISTHPPELAGALDALVSVIKNLPPMPEKQDESNDLIWLSQLVREHNVFRDCFVTSSWTFEEQQRLLELWTYVGWRDTVRDKDALSILSERNAARAFAYDMRNYSQETLWGPFLPGKKGSVNWQHIRALITVVFCNLHDLGMLWQDTRPPSNLDALRPYSAPRCHGARNPRDWAGVEGTWRRYVCFMDYRDLFSMFRRIFQLLLQKLTQTLPTYNNSIQRAYDKSFFDDPEFQEATRLIELSFRITKIQETAALGAEAQGSSARLATATSPGSPEPGPMTDEAAARAREIRMKYPTIYFVGTSRGGNGNEAKVKGTVRMTPEGYIRWRFMRKASALDGHSQWSSEGIQIGAMGSAAGVVGVWTGAQHEEGDPAGPFWLFKVEDNHPSYMHHGHN